MVVKMMKWPPWQPPSSSSTKKFEAILSIKSIEGLVNSGDSEKGIFFVEVQWKGQQKGMALRSLRRSTKKNLTREYFVSENGVVSFDDEEFRNVCGFSGPKDGLFYPWEIVFTVFNGHNQGPKSKTSVLGTASLNLTEYVYPNEGKDFELKIPIIIPGDAFKSFPFMNIFLSVTDLRIAQELSGTVMTSRTPSPNSPLSLDLSSPAKDEFSALKSSLRKVKTFTDFVSSRRSKKTPHEEDGSDCRSSVKSDDGPFGNSLEVDSAGDGDDDTRAGGESEETKEDGLGIKIPVSYESLASANCAQGSFYYGGDNNGLVYYSNRRRHDEGCPRNANPVPMIISEETEQPRLKRGFLSWKKKRKLDYVKALKAKDEPLLKKDYKEDGGDDIDYDRRQLSPSDESGFLWQDGMTPNGSSFSEFGEDNFTVGRWQSKEITSRDGNLKLRTQVFFGSIDQRSERAAGESACTVLVAVVADWLQTNRGLMPIKSEFDGLIREGSSEWRALCENKDYLERFPDKHFDIETVLEAKIRPLAVAPDKSFIGFFQPEGLKHGELDLLQGAMTFDGIWDEISESASELSCDHGSSAVYVVSWNDHFFVLKADRDAFYLIDTLGERLFEGCDQAYILKFDRDTTIRVSNEEARQVTDDKNVNDAKMEEEEEIVCKGKECCREYIKSFLAAIPIRELQNDLKKGLTSPMLVHHRLQIEFHYTKPSQQFVAEFPATESAMDIDPQ